MNTNPFKHLLAATLLLACTYATQAQERYFTRTGTIAFFSETPMENIEAHNYKVTSVWDATTGAVEFAALIKAFEFEKALMQEHFNENYMETAVYQEATFSGKIIEDIDLSVPGTYSVRAKGKLNVHGIEQERIIKSTVESKENVLIVRSDFTVLLAEHNISIPRIVYQKIAEEIQVHVEATFSR